MRRRSLRVLAQICCYFSISAFARAELSAERMSELVYRGYWPNYSNLTASEKQQMIAEFRRRESAGEFAAAKHQLNHNLFLLGDRRAHDEVIAEFRQNAVHRGIDADFRLLAASPYLDTIPAIADLLWNKGGGSPPESDVGVPTADGYTAWAIGGHLARSHELPVPVVEWARTFGEIGRFSWVEILQDWWVKNEQAFREKRYQDVVPGISVEPFLEKAQNPDPSLSTHPEMQNPPQGSPNSETTAAERSSPFVWIGFCLAVAISLILLLSVRRGRC